MRHPVRVTLAAVGVAVVALWAASLRPGKRVEVRAALTLADAMGGTDTAGYARVRSPRPFSFPTDHGPHTGYKTEWWYFTGNLEDDDGRRFGYQLTFFRSALSPVEPVRRSAWAAAQVYMAHFTVTDIERREFHDFERFSRGAAGLAGARAAPFRVWVEDWAAESLGSGGSGTAAGSPPDSNLRGRAGRVHSGAGRDVDAGLGTFPLTLRAAEEDVSIDLVLERGRPPVAHGLGGLSQKGPGPGNASHYYSLTRMATQGRVRLGERTYSVRGTSWMDHEWGTSSLGEDRTGWDWFGLQLSDGSDLMLYRFRRRDGGLDAYNAGTLIAPNGAIRALSYRDFELTVLDEWRSPADRVAYPARWRVRLPAAGLDLEVRPAIPDQELRAAVVRYWEGAVLVRGSGPTGPLTGRGYMELTGYAERPPRPITGAS